jgi:hypothetical protein
MVASDPTLVGGLLMRFEVDISGAVVFAGVFLVLGVAVGYQLAIHDIKTAIARFDEKLAIRNRLDDLCRPAKVGSERSVGTERARSK